MVKIFRRLPALDPRGSLHINRDSAGRSLGGAGRRGQRLASAHNTAPGRWYMRKVERENDLTRYEESNYNEYGKKSYGIYQSQYRNLTQKYLKIHVVIFVTNSDSKYCSNVT